MSDLPTVTLYGTEMQIVSVVAESATTRMVVTPNREPDDAPTIIADWLEDHLPDEYGCDRGNAATLIQWLNEHDYAIVSTRRVGK